MEGKHWLGPGVRPRIVELSADIRGVLRALFELCDAAKSLRLGEMGAHVASLLCGAMTGTYINDLFATDEDDEGSGAASALPARWVPSKAGPPRWHSSAPRHGMPFNPRNEGSK